MQQYVSDIGFHSELAAVAHSVVNEECFSLWGVYNSAM